MKDAKQAQSPLPPCILCTSCICSLAHRPAQADVQTFDYSINPLPLTLREIEEPFASDEPQTPVLVAWGAALPKRGGVTYPEAASGDNKRHKCCAPRRSTFQIPGSSPARGRRRGERLGTLRGGRVRRPQTLDSPGSHVSPLRRFAAQCSKGSPTLVRVIHVGTRPRSSQSSK